MYCIVHRKEDNNEWIIYVETFFHVFETNAITLSIVWLSSFINRSPFIRQRKIHCLNHFIWTFIIFPIEFDSMLQFHWSMLFIHSILTCFIVFFDIFMLTAYLISIQIGIYHNEEKYLHFPFWFCSWFILCSSSTMSATVFTLSIVSCRVFCVKIYWCDTKPTNQLKFSNAEKSTQHFTWLW